MRKGLIFILGIISFLGINTVSADEIHLEYDTNINEVKPYIDEIGYDVINSVIDKNIEHYNNNLSNDYPYYFIYFYVNTFNNFRIVLLAFSELNYSYNSVFASYSSESLYHFPIGGRVVQLTSEYDKNNKVFSDLNFSEGSYSNPSLIKITSDKKQYNPYSYYYSNFDLYYKGTVYTEEVSSLTHLDRNDILYIPSLNDSSYYSEHKANTDFLLHPYYLYDGNTSLEETRYTTINLNAYSYVILSLKDYTPRDTFHSPGYYKGQLCITPVYNYGSEEKKDYISGWQAPPCGDYLENYTFYNLIVKEEDITNHAVLYLTGYDSSKPNFVKVDNSTFNITYITSENENTPNVSIGGKNYNTLPYSSLTDTSALTEKNGIDTTWTCAKYDTDCFLDSSGIDIDNLFSSPLDTLKDVWDTITSIFKLITEFISLLPDTMQAFLYLAFGVGIALGIIKIIL